MSYFIWYKKPSETKWTKYNFEFPEKVWADHQANLFRNANTKKEFYYYTVSETEPKESIAC